MSGHRPVRALLLDLEGTVFETGRLVPGAAEALARTRERGVKIGFVTNTTSRPRSALVAELAGMGLPIDPESVFTAPRAGQRYLARRGWTRCHFLVRPALLEDFEGILAEDVSPQAVVVGDLGEEFTFLRLNCAFRLLLAGAELVTLALSRYYRGSDGLLLDVGAFVAALEYASGREATLVGKPSAEFFRAAVEALGATPQETIAVGDDLESDVGGAQRAGLRGVLVRTGKFSPLDLERSAVRPDAILDSIAQVADLF